MTGSDFSEITKSTPEKSLTVSLKKNAGRNNQGKITVDGVEYPLPRNNYGHCLHGGPKGYQYQVFDARQLSNQVLELTYLSKDGEEGFPGNLTCKVTF